jgi:hypothetical protein
VRGRRPRGQSADVVTGKLKVHDPFELIRWLAMSQPDPRKALAELVQNSLDAGARTVRITRAREKGTPLVRIFDDGVGVIPEMERQEALSYLATHVGHSRKRSLSPAERLQLMTQGQYGIGLLGFWSLGETLEIRTSLPGQRPHRLVLYRDRPEYLIEPLRGRLALDETYTEVVVAGLHREALSAVGGSRIADYLAAELRGQLIERGVDLTVEDRISRGRSRKLIPVRPPRFLGERLEAFSRLEVEGYPPARLEIYLRGEGASAPASEGSPSATPGLAVYAAGTLVAETFHDLSALQLDREPWTDGRLTGLVDFPALRVAPGSRRGVVPDEAAGAFGAALALVAPALQAVLEAAERRREEQLERGIVKELQRAFRDFFRHRPRYSSLPVEPEKEGIGGEERLPGSSPPEGTEARGPDLHPAPEAEPSSPGNATLPDAVVKPLVEQPVFLFPPGPLALLEIYPPRLKIPAGTKRRLVARPLDESGRDLEEEVFLEWSISPGVGAIEARDSDRNVVLVAGADPVVGWVRALARSAGRIVEARVDVEVSDPPAPPGMGEGIPQPELVDAPGALWRSRLEGGRWQVNSGHRDYRLLSGKAVVKLRYLALLFAKEVVLRSSSDPRLAEPLEQLVEVAAYADRHIRKK